MTEKYPFHIGDVPKGERVAILEEFYEIEGVVQATEQFGREGLLLDCGQMLYPLSALHCRVISVQGEKSE